MGLLYFTTLLGSAPNNAEHLLTQFSLPEAPYSPSVHKYMNFDRWPIDEELCTQHVQRTPLTELLKSCN